MPTSPFIFHLRRAALVIVLGAIVIGFFHVNDAWKSIPAAVSSKARDLSTMTAFKPYVEAVDEDTTRALQQEPSNTDQYVFVKETRTEFHQELPGIYRRAKTIPSKSKGGKGGSSAAPSEALACTPLPPSDQTSTPLMGAMMKKKKSRTPRATMKKKKRTAGAMMKKKKKKTRKLMENDKVQEVYQGEKGNEGHEGLENTALEYSLGQKTSNYFADLATADWQVQGQHLQAHRTRFLGMMKKKRNANRGTKDSPSSEGASSKGKGSTGSPVSCCFCLLYCSHAKEDEC